MNNEAADKTQSDEKIRIKDARLEVCESCHNEQDILAAVVGQQTFISENPEIRRKFLVAHLAKLNIDEPENATLIIQSYEIKRQASDPEFDVTSLSGKKLQAVLDRRKESAQASAEFQSAKVELTKDKKDKASYEQQINSLLASGHSNVEIIQTLVNDPVTPATERGKLQAFQSILNVAQIVPADALIIATRMNTMDFSQGIPNPQEFVTWAVFDSPNLSSGISEVTQTAIAAKLGITRHKYSVKTGGDVKEVFEKGLGVETYLNENGQTQTRTVPLAPGKDVKIRDNQYLSVDSAGNKHLKITTSVGDYQTTLPDNPTNEDMTQIVASTQMIAAFHDLNLAEVFYERPLTERGGGEIDLRFPGDFNRTKQLCQILFDGAAGYDGEILEQSDINKIPYLMQFHSSKGDGMRGDVAPEMMRKELEAQGAIKNGSVNWLRFEEMVTANRANMYVAPGNFAK